MHIFKFNMFALYFFRLFALLLELASGTVTVTDATSSTCTTATHTHTSGSKILKPLDAATDAEVIIEQNHQISNHASNQVCLKRCAAYASCHAVSTIRVTTTIKYCIMIAGPVTTAETWTVTTDPASNPPTALHTPGNWQQANELPFWQQDNLGDKKDSDMTSVAFIMDTACRWKTLGQQTWKNAAGNDETVQERSCLGLQIEDVQLSGASVTAAFGGTYNECLGRCARESDCVAFAHASSPTEADGQPTCWLKTEVTAEEERDPKQGFVSLYMSEGCRNYATVHGIGKAAGDCWLIPFTETMRTPTDHDDENDDYILVVVVGLCCVAAVVGGAVLVRSHIKTKETLMLRRQRLRNIVPHGAGSRLQQGAYVLPLGRPITPASYAARREHFAQRRKGKGKGAGKGKHGRPPPLYY